MYMKNTIKTKHQAFIFLSELGRCTICITEAIINKFFVSVRPKNLSHVEINMSGLEQTKAGVRLRFFLFLVRIFLFYIENATTRQS